MTSTTFRLVSTFVLALLCTTSAHAQLKLPHRPKEAAPSEEPRGNVAPYLTCKVCGARSYTAAVDGRKDEEGNPLVWCDTCKRDTAHSSNFNTEPGIGDAQRPGTNGGGGGLKLPSGKSTAGPTAQPTNTGGNVAPGKVDPNSPNSAAPSSGGPNSGAQQQQQDGSRSAASNAVNAMFAEIAKARAIEDSLVDRGIESLIAAGDTGLVAAREQLNVDQPTVVYAAARVLMHAGAADDIELVKSRIRGKIPNPVVQPLVELLLKRDPIRVGPSYLAELLEHPQSSVRQVAERQLRKSITVDMLPLLEPRLASKRGETRLAALLLVADIADPRATDVLVRSIDDPNSRLATAAVSALAAREDAGLDARLLGVAFRDRWILRRSAYALLAIIEREDQKLVPVLDEKHVESLLTALDSTDPFIAGVAASALAGIGFRSRDAAATDWLDRAVVDRLVVVASGKEYHDDYSALLTPALRRLRTITGQTIQNDGPKWVTWWVGVRDGFHARRASLVIDASEIGQVIVHFESTGDTPESFALVGPESADKAESNTSAAEIVYLDARQISELVSVLTREGLLAADKLPGLRGSHGRGERTVEIAVKGRAKAFTLGSGASEPWFDRAAQACRAVREQNRWQRFPEAGKHANSHALWLEQNVWWSGEHSEIERSARLKSLAIASMRGGSPAQRTLAVTELERLYAIPGNAEAADFQPLLDLMRLESAQTDRARRLARLVLAAGCKAGTDGHIPDPLAYDLAVASCALFGTSASDAIGEELQAANREFVRKIATDERPVLRAVAARVLAKAPSPEDLKVLIKLLDDKDPSVETAAALALGESKVEGARMELLVRARVGLPAVRVPSLEAIGKLGGDYVLEALVQGLGDPDPDVRLAAVKGLSSLADPSAAQVLVSLLGEQGDSPLFDAARAGLAKMGPAAYPDLIRAVNSATGRGRREAALLLSEQGQPEAASPLLSILSANPRDTRVANELAVLTCADMRSQPDPAAAWWSWWDGVRHDDALAWARAALERLGIQPPPPGTLEGAGTMQGRLFLLTLMARPEAWLVERARREFQRMTTIDTGAVPPLGAERDAWLRRLRDNLERTTSRG